MAFNAVLKSAFILIIGLSVAACETVSPVEKLQDGSFQLSVKVSGSIGLEHKDRQRAHELALAHCESRGQVFDSDGIKLDRTTIRGGGRAQSISNIRFKCLDELNYSPGDRPLVVVGP